MDSVRVDIVVMDTAQDNAVPQQPPCQQGFLEGTGDPILTMPWKDSFLRGYAPAAHGHGADMGFVSPMNQNASVLRIQDHFRLYTKASIVPNKAEPFHLLDTP